MYAPPLPHSIGDVYLVDENTSIVYTTICHRTMSLGGEEDKEKEKEKEALNSPDSSRPNSESCRLRVRRTKFTKMRAVLVFLDFFDSFLDKRAYFEQLAEACPDTTFVLFNLPGQARTAYDDRSTILNNAFYRVCIDYFLYYLEEIDLVDLTLAPFGVIAFGNGANIALYWGTVFITISSATHKRLVALAPWDASFQRVLVRGRDNERLHHEVHIQFPALSVHSPELH
ncbi:MAG: hypothetical protein P4M11_14550 [Candidatus Pacebacteria bacterium]|nr:hypothetical protein [Candidatus Paceibacterota bacterium]